MLAFVFLLTLADVYYKQRKGSIVHLLSNVKHEYFSQQPQACSFPQVTGQNKVKKKKKR